MIHKLANVNPDAKIGNQVTIDAFASIDKNVEIGDGTIIMPNAVILDGARIGKNCIVFPGAVVSAVPQDLKFKGEETTTIIGDNTTIRECATINRGTYAKGSTKIGNNCLVMSYVHIAHDCIVGNNVILVSYTGLAGEVEVDDFAILGGGTRVHQFVRIGCHTMIGGNGVVRKDVPPYIRASRDPLSFVGINSIGLRRRQFEPEKIKLIQDMYRIIFQSGMNNTNALHYIMETYEPCAEREEVVNFVKKSKRGILKGYTGVVSGDEEDD